MDYSYERRYRRQQRRNRSSSSHGIISSRDEDDLEQEIIDRAMQIERSREKSLRRQFEYIVYNVKKLERRRHQRHRTRSPDCYQRTNSCSRHQNSDSIPNRSYRDSSSEQYCSPYDSNYLQTKSRSSSKLRKFLPYQITMIYRGNGPAKHGDEIMVLQENLIIFKGFLRPQENFTFKFKRPNGFSIVKLDFFINELFECSLPIDCENEQINQENELFQLDHLQITEFHQKDEIDDQNQSINKTNKSILIDQKQENENNFIMNSPSINDGKRSTLDNGRDHHKTKSHHQNFYDQEKPNETPIIKQQSQRSQSPSETSSVPKTKEIKHVPLIKSGKSESNLNEINSSTPRQLTSINERNTKVSSPSRIECDNDANYQIYKTRKTTQKPNYGPPGLASFVPSDTESNPDETPIVVKQNDEEKPSSEIVKPTETFSEKKDDNEEEETTDSGGLTNFLQLLQLMSGGSIRFSSTTDDGDGIQGLLTRLGIVTQRNNQKTNVNITPRQIGNVENFLLIYLDSSFPDDSILKKCRALINYFKIFDDPDDCIAFINSISDEKIIIIVNDTLGDPVVSRVQDLQQLFAIYVLCQTNEQVDSWSRNQPKIRGIFTNINDTLNQIKHDIENDEENSLTFSCALTTGNTKNETFIKNQILKDILLDPDETNEAKNELIDFSRIEYENNDQQLKFIQQFQNEYQKENVHQFYQKDLFLSKMLNKGFRIPEVDILFKLRIFIQDLHNFIISSSNQTSIGTIYRLQFLTNEEIDTIKTCVNNGFIAFSNFFVATKECPEQNSLKRRQDDNGEEILFQIDVTNYSGYKLIDNTILVTFGFVTRVTNFEKDKNGKTIIKLKAVTQTDRQLETIIEPMRKVTRASHPSLRIVKLFIELEQYSLGVHLGQVLLADLPNARKDPLLALARTFHSLGTTLYEKEEYDQALDVIKKSHELYLRFLPEDAPQLSPTWNNMGSIYLRQGKTDLALEYHEKALSIQLKSPSPDLPSIISYSNNIGGVYLKLERYDEALVHFKRALQIEEQTLPTNHPELAGTYHRIGGVYFRQNNYEKALEFYDKTLEIELVSLPDNHPTVAVTYHNRGTAFEGLGRLEEAVESAEKAVERLLKTLPKEHPQVRMNQAYVDRLKQKLWVKQLFTS